MFDLPTGDGIFWNPGQARSSLFHTSIYMNRSAPEVSGVVRRRVCESAAVLVAVDLLEPFDVFAVDLLLDGDVGHGGGGGCAMPMLLAG